MNAIEFQARLEILRPGKSFIWIGDDFENFRVNNGINPEIIKPTWEEILAVQLPEPKVIEAEIVE